MTRRFTMMMAVLGLGLDGGAGGPLQAAEVPVEVLPQDVAITVFNEIETEGFPLLMPVAQQAGMQVEQQTADFRQQRQRAQVPRRVRGRPIRVKTGMALVKDRRVLTNLRQGENVVRFTDVAATLDPTSVWLGSETDPAAIVVVEQNFEYDLATPGALLERYIDRQITCVDKDGGTRSGYLCSYDDAQIVLSQSPPAERTDDQRTEILARNGLRALRFPEMPQGLFVKPTLVWTLRAERAGRHDVTLAYLCGRMKWEAEYIAVLEPDEAGGQVQLGLRGWVSIDNRSGATYPDAGIKLIAGDVNRVPDPWAPPPTPDVPEAALYPAAMDMAQAAIGGRAAEKVFEEKAFFEYHLYTLSAPSTVRDRQLKQLRLLSAEDVEATRRYVSDPHAEGGQVAVELTLLNEKENHLGMPLPKGRVRLVQRDDDGALQYLAEDEIDHTPKGEEVELTMGRAFDVTAERVQTDERRPSERHEIQSYRLRMRNHKDQPIRGRFVERLRPNTNWMIIEADQRWTREDVSTIHFDFELAANAEKQITYTVDYRW